MPISRHLGIRVIDICWIYLWSVHAFFLTLEHPGSYRHMRDLGVDCHYNQGLHPATWGLQRRWKGLQKATLVFTTTGRISKWPGTEVGDNSTWFILIFTWHVPILICLDACRYKLGPFQTFSNLNFGSLVRRRTAWTDYKLGEAETRTLSRQSTADTDLGVSDALWWDFLIFFKKRCPKCRLAISVKVNTTYQTFFLFEDRHCCDNPYCLEQPDALRSGFTIQIQAQWYQDEPIDPELVDVIGSPEVPWMLHPTYQSAGGCPDVLQDPRLVEPQPERLNIFLPNKQGAFDLVQHGKEKNGWGFWYSRT